MKVKTALWLPILLFGASIAVADEIDTWPSANKDLQNTASNLKEDKINPANVNKLQILWQYETAPDSNTPDGALGNVSSTPSVSKDKVFFSDWSGNVTAVDRKTGALIWKKNLLNEISIPGHVMNYSRNTPTYTKGMVIIGESYLINAPLCEPNETATESLGCNKGDGATVVALSEEDGSVIWRYKVDNHLSAKVTGSVSVHKGVVYVPVASWEEDHSRNYTDPNDSTQPYPCCTFRGSIVALDRDTGAFLWKSYTSIGNDPDNTLDAPLRNILFEENRTGYWGVSTYGHAPTIDKKRDTLYYATGNPYNAPKKAVECELERRDLEQAVVDIDGLPNGVTCSNLNEKLKTYHNAIVSINQSDGSLNWVFYSRQYDAWNHSCDAPDLAVGGIFPPVLVPLPLSNTQNCPDDLVGPDLGFGQQPMLIKKVNINGESKDIVAAVNKDGRLFAVNADNGELLWEAQLGIGNIYGGGQFGIASDGKRIFVPTVNGSNVNRNKDLDFVSAQQYRDDNGFTALGIRGGLFHARDGDKGSPYPGPGPFLPFDGPHIFYGPQASEYEGFVPDLITGPVSGPKDPWTLINPPSDVPIDNMNVFYEDGQLKTIAGVISAVDVKTGNILWQRPVVDGVSGQLSIASAIGSIAVTKNIVFAGYLDTKGTFVALDSETGQKLYQFNNLIDSDGNGTFIQNGGIEGGPAIVDGVVYLGIGGGTSGALNPALAGNRVYALGLADDDTTSDDSSS